MSVVLTILGIITGATVALILNKILATKIEDKNHRIGLKIAAYMVCIILGVSFALICSLRTLLDNFIKDRIEFIEVKLVEAFPDSNILEIGIDISELSSIVPELRQVVNDVDISNNGIFEKLVFDTF
jgi:hypothetical protein